MINRLRFSGQADWTLCVQFEALVRISPRWWAYRKKLVIKTQIHNTVGTERETSLELADLLLGKQALYQLSYSRMLVILSRVLLELCTAELFGGSTAVAVCAPHVTLGDLTLKSGPRDMTDQPGDSSPLLRWIAMIEFENDRIALAAIDTRMQAEVVVNLLTALLAVELPLGGCAFEICRPVPSIVFS